ncbi:VWA domain-containing protein [Sphaerisporangium sp. TRM90804]|uniref:vWA domain-containing protein n=1 Tax=Sphaerisporangium sp. TRM90804 TaxID=3031113 RepID=UPI00244D1EF0|nr:VWA domain-containing protein [Sphaerisporangium sp. TRM90804]MDH2428635.1 VWA domain-containing protein [Sphaerisporangium sp. TRM90804]
MADGTTPHAIPPNGAPAAPPARGHGAPPPSGAGPRPAAGAEGRAAEGEAAVAATMTGFARTLRAAGVAADHERTRNLLLALRHVDAADPGQVYWAGRLTLCAGPDDLPRYDRCFAAYFGGERPRPSRRAPTTITITRHTVSPDSAEGRDDDSGEAVPATATRAEVLRHRDVARLTAAERAEVNRMLALLRARREQRRSRRYVPARAGRLDVRRTTRETLRRGGETARLYRRARRERPRRVVLIVDVSGSMAAYADTLLRFAHALVRREPRATEVFSAGTRLTRVTAELRHRDPDTAMRLVSAAVPDWSGGTRLGDELKAFLDRRSGARGAVVVIASDGWERGDPALLGRQMARLSRLARRVVWVNPHKGRDGYQPLTGGMRAALPHVDSFVAGHSLAAFEELAERLAHA